MTIEYPKLLLVDSYDSFTHNLASLCRQAIPNCSVNIIKNDDFTISELLPYLPFFSAVIVGPGPGSPENLQDVGVVKDLWKIQDEHLIPIFGVCLGLQSLGVEFGAQLKRLHVVKHGQVSRIHHDGVDIFDGVGIVDAVRYHSLHVELVSGGEIEQLAWADDGVENGPIVMALRHRTRPFWAVQYHPESACTHGGGLQVIQNFWQLAENWASKTGRNTRPWVPAAKRVIGPSWPHLQPHSPPPPLRSRPIVTTNVIDLPHLSVTTICELLGVTNEQAPFVLLDSAAKPGRFSIIASLTSSSPQITYFTGDAFVHIEEEKSKICVNLGSHDIWSWLATFMRRRKAIGGCTEIPFWGGLVGHLSYELGVESLNVPVKPGSSAGNDKRHPDVNLVFVERSVVVDVVTSKAYVQSLSSDDDDWIIDTASALKDASSKAHLETQFQKTSWPTTALQYPPTVTLPDKARYISRINQAKEHLFAGDSYELCLTAPTHLRLLGALPSPTTVSSSWERYKNLRKNNPAPHSAYLRLHPTTLLSSSPERFLSFTRPPGTVCQLRPIKGTIRKSPEITRAIAEQALAGSTKEVAENLMIVDLIRHDLHGVVGEDVQVKQFCRVEEYETVWQLVSVIEGRLPLDSSTDLDPDGEVGWEVLRRSLPPGSMTGAPKKRSVEILQTLEDNDRSIYSGVFGYWCAGGGGDWSVTIRSCFKYDGQHASNSQNSRAREDSSPDTETEEWVIGAGGAITALSDADAEWEEMTVKLRSVLRAFNVTVPENH